VRCLEDGDTVSSVLAEFLGILDGLDTKVKAVYLDLGSYDSKCLTLLQAHNYVYVCRSLSWERQFSRWSQKLEPCYRLSPEREFDGHSWTVKFPVYIDCKLSKKTGPENK